MVEPRGSAQSSGREDLKAIPANAHVQYQGSAISAAPAGRRDARSIDRRSFASPGGSNVRGRTGSTPSSHALTCVATERTGTARWLASELEIESKS